MAEPRVVKTFPAGKGLEVRILHDETQPEDSIDKWITEAVCVGGPDSEPFIVPPHWHKYHSEHLTVLEGKVEVLVGDKTHVISAGETVSVPAGIVHGITGFTGEKMVLRERPDPPGDYKVQFFNDFLSEGPSMTFWHTMRTFYDGDGYPALPLYFRFFDVAFVTVFGGIAKLFVPAKKVEKWE